MIRVNKKFYEKGCTMEGKGNRIILNKKCGTKHMEIIFRNHILVEIKVFTEDGTEYQRVGAVVKFLSINEITANDEGKPEIYVRDFMINLY